MRDVSKELMKKMRIYTEGWTTTDKVIACCQGLVAGHIALLVLKGPLEGVIIMYILYR